MEVLMREKEEEEEKKKKKKNEEEEEKDAESLKDSDKGSIIDHNIKMNTSAADNSKGEGSCVKKQKNSAAARRSGFRICKPQGTFLWPNMAGSAGGAGGSGCSCTAATTASPVTFSSAITSISSTPNRSGAVPTTTNYNNRCAADVDDHHQHHQVGIMYGDGGIPTPPSCSSSATSAPKLPPLIPSPSSSSLTLSPRGGPPFGCGGSRTLPTTSSMFSPLMTMTAAAAHVPSSFVGGGGEGKKRADEKEIARAGMGWGTITTDLVLATPSHHP